MFQFAGLPPPGLFGSARGGLGITPAGFPHSDIFGSTSARDSPKLFAACHVLHRLLAPRHPPRALCSLTPFSSWPGTPVSHTGDRDDPLTTRRNRSSSIAETYPVGKVRPNRCRPHGEPSLVVPAIRWSVASGGGHGSGDRSAAWTQNDGSRTSLRAVTMTARLGPEGHLGVLPELFNS
jgi:hypothetical protein